LRTLPRTPLSAFRMASTSAASKFTDIVVGSHPEFAGADDASKAEVEKQVNAAEGLAKDLPVSRK
jgi:hypothetical protein